MVRKPRSPRSTRDDVDRQLRRWPPRRIACWSMMLFGIAVAGQHLVAHAGFRPLPISMGWQDLLAGYPMAALLAITGAVLVDPRPPL